MILTFDLWSWKQLATHMLNIFAKFHWNPHTKQRNITSRSSSSSSSSRNEYYLGGIIALLLQDHRTMSIKSEYVLTDGMDSTRTDGRTDRKPKNIRLSPQRVLIHQCCNYIKRFTNITITITT